MEFRPCIDIHNGCVKQIIGGSLNDQGDLARENYVSKQDAAFYAELYREKKLRGGHVILLNGEDSIYYEATKKQAMNALQAWPGGLQVGGGIRPENAAAFLEAGASHVIVTSYLFENGQFSMKRLEGLTKEVGREHLVLDLSCKRVEAGEGTEYRIATNRWQTVTDSVLTKEFLEQLSVYCDEFLIHAVDVEGKSRGIELTVAALLGEYAGESEKSRPVTYAGGVHNYEDLKLLKHWGKNKVNVTIGSALDLFGGEMELEKVIELSRK